MSTENTGQNGISTVLFRMLLVWPAAGALMGFLLGAASFLAMRTGVYLDSDDFFFAMRAVVPAGLAVGFVAGLITVPLTRSRPLGVLLLAFGGGALALGIPAAFVPSGLSFEMGTYYFLPLIGALAGYCVLGPVFLRLLAPRRVDRFSAA